MANEDIPATIRGLYMDDFKRRIDFVLAYKLPPPELDPMRASTSISAKLSDQPATSSPAAGGETTGEKGIELEPLTKPGGSAPAPSASAQPPGFFARVFCCRKETSSELDSEALKRHIRRRNFFEKNLQSVGIQLEYSDSKELDVRFVKLHAPFHLLRTYANSLRMRMPLRQDLNIRIQDKLLDKNCRLSDLNKRPTSSLPRKETPSFTKRLISMFFEHRELPPEPHKCTAVYNVDRELLFDINANNKESAFTESQRHYIVDFILDRTLFSKYESQQDIENFMGIEGQGDGDDLENRSSQEPRPASHELPEGSADAEEETESGVTYGIEHLIAEGTYLAAYPLHDSDVQPVPTEHKPSCAQSGMSRSKQTTPSHENPAASEAADLLKRHQLRTLLFRHWGSWWNVLSVRFQPLDHVRAYLGEQFAFYFAWLGFYTLMLLPASIFGLIVFIYGVRIVWFSDDPVTKELCNSTKTLCPACTNHTQCVARELKSFCTNFKIQRAIDNTATVVWAVFISLWGTVFLEFWKRQQAKLQYRWNLNDFDAGEEPARPAFMSLKTKTKRPNPITGETEPNVKFWRSKLPRMLSSYIGVVFLVFLAIAFLVAVIIYRLVLVFFIRMINAHQWKFASMVPSMTAACINVVIITVLNKIYEPVAKWLTEAERWRTQSEFDKHLTVKLYLLQFVNYYSSLIYVAFIKGRFGDLSSEDPVNFRTEVCPSSHCLYELCFQLAIIMLGKQLIQNTLMEVLLPIFMPLVKRLFKLCFKKKATADGNAPNATPGSSSIASTHCRRCISPLERDYQLDPVTYNSLFGEYLEMILQFGFVTLFAVAFPIAPLAAFLNNILEVRCDSFKYMVHTRRPVADIDEGNIGIWYNILFFLSRLAVITNAFLIAFTSDFVPRTLYRRSYNNDRHDYSGYSDWALSEFYRFKGLNRTWTPVNDTGLPSANDPAWNEARCFHWGFFTRGNDLNDSSESEMKGRGVQPTLIYWQVLALRLVLVLAFTYGVLLITSFIAYLIPDKPSNIEEQEHREKYLTQQLVLQSVRRERLALSARPASFGQQATTTTTTTDGAGPVKRSAKLYPSGPIAQPPEKPSQSQPPQALNNPNAIGFIEPPAPGFAIA